MSRVAARTGAARSTSPAPTATKVSRSSFLEISPQSAERRHGGQRRRFRAQHAWAQADRHEAGGSESGFFLFVESGFRTGGDDERRPAFFHVLREAQARRGRKQNPRRRIRWRPVVGNRQQSVDRRDAVTAALLAGRDDDFLP